MNWKKGTELSLQDQRFVLAAYINRYTKKHTPKWVFREKEKGTIFKPQFEDDTDWLKNTRFKVTKSGRVDMRIKRCESNPTWPDGKQPICQRT